MLCRHGVYLWEEKLIFSLTPDRILQVSQCPQITLTVEICCIYAHFWIKSTCNGDASFRYPISIINLVCYLIDRHATSSMSRCRNKFVNACYYMVPSGFAHNTIWYCSRQAFRFPSCDVFTLGQLMSLVFPFPLLRLIYV